VEDLSPHEVPAELSSRTESPWGSESHPLKLLARTVTMDYVVTFVELATGVFMLPFNTSHLGQSAYGLWVLTASITVYFSMLNLGYAEALVKFVAEYRAKRDSTRLNEIVSTMFFVFAGVGLLAYGIAAVLASNLRVFLNLSPEQARTGKYLLLIISAYIACGFPFSVFGAVANGFQRRYLNGVIAITTHLLVAVVNVVVLLLGYGLVELVACTTAIRLLSYLGYRLNAYRVFPALRVSTRYLRLSRLKELTAFSVFMFLIDLANKLNYATDVVVVGAFLSTAAVATWAVAQRLTDITKGLTDQFNYTLFPLVVDRATVGDDERLQVILLHGTRFSLAMVLPVCTLLGLFAEQIVSLWVGPRFNDSVPIIRILAVIVIVRVGNSTAMSLLRGGGKHRVLTASNLTIAIANVVLSVILVQRYGLIGVALGTLIPLAVVCVFVLFPVACRTVNLGVSAALGRAVWPSLWPAVCMATVVVFSRGFAPKGFIASAFLAIAAALFYLVLFLFLAVGSEERNWYFAKLRQIAAPQKIMPARASE